ncbi:hypothetical protein FACS189434_09920 [Bacteroidia bacterium]|nr:hypothetical protein FACS189434_09920 [Bacteroidia bacterium]
MRKNKRLLTAGQKYTFKTGCDDGATANFDTYMYLYDTSGSLLTLNDDGCSSRSKIEDYRQILEFSQNLHT